MAAVRGLARRPPPARLNAVLVHEPRHPVYSTRLPQRQTLRVSAGSQRGMNARAAVTALAVSMNTADFLRQRLVRLGAGAIRSVAPGVVAAGADPQHRSHDPHEENLADVLDETEPHLGGPNAIVRHFEAARDLLNAVPLPEKPTSVKNPFG